MPPAHPGPDVAFRHVVWSKAWRIIASRYPPIAVFERVSDNPQVRDALIELEQITNPRLRDQIGEIHLVPPERRVTGNNASWVMAPFTHINKRGSRFSDGTFGVYYAGESLDTAIAETAYHFAIFASDANDPLRREDMRVLVGAIDRRFDDVAVLDETTRAGLLDRNSYARSQPFGVERRSAGSDGLVYPSVRRPGGACVAAFWPDTIGIPVQERHLQYEWDGKAISRYFDFSLDQWLPLP